MTQKKDKLRNFKCGISSFLANYIAGLLHPFDVIKTRFQSKCKPIQAMMEKQLIEISSRNTMEYCMPSNKYTPQKASKDSLKASICQYSARPLRCPYFSGCTAYFKQLRKPKIIFYQKQLVHYARSFDCKSRSRNLSFNINSTFLGCQNSNDSLRKTPYELMAQLFC